MAYPETSSLTGTGKVVDARQFPDPIHPKCGAATDCLPPQLAACTQTHQFADWQQFPINFNEQKPEK
jgi:hypothetical protein